MRIWTSVCYFWEFLNVNTDVKILKEFLDVDYGYYGNMVRRLFELENQAMSSHPAVFGPALAWIQEKFDTEPGFTRFHDERNIRRSRQRHGLPAMALPMVDHPFKSVYPRASMNKYIEHLEIPWTAAEDRLLGLAMYVPCCRMGMECPRIPTASM
jgi:hypothetical protein